MPKHTSAAEYQAAIARAERTERELRSVISGLTMTLEASATVLDLMHESMTARATDGSLQFVDGYLEVMKLQSNHIRKMAAMNADRATKAGA